MQLRRDQSKGPRIFKTTATQRENGEPDFGAREQVGNEVGARIEPHSDDAGDQSWSDREHNPGDERDETVNEEKHRQAAARGHLRAS